MQSLILIYSWGKFQLFLYALAILGSIFFWDTSYLAVTLIGYILFGMVGLEIAHHRFYSHGSFECKRLTEWFLYVCSIFAACGGPIYYSGLHRTHHKTADTDKDPHRPFDQPFLSFLHCNDRSRSEIDWKIVRDLTSKPELIFLTEHYGKVYFGTIFLTAIVNPTFSLFFFVFPGIIVLWLTGLINVINHRYGYRNFNTNDSSTNNSWINLITFGGGLHHNHHYKPWSYTNKVKWFEHDIAGWFIKNIFATKVRT